MVGIPEALVDERPPRADVLEAQFAMRAQAHEPQNIGVRLLVDEHEIGFEMAVSKS